MNDTNISSSAECSQPASYMWALRIAYSVIFVLGTFGNAVVCLAILKRKKTQNSCNLFTFNLAFHDLILVILYVPTQMIALENCFSWVIGRFMCHLVYFILPTSQSVSIGVLLAITADRYRAIVFPVKARLARKTVFQIIVVIWVVSVATALPFIFVIKLVDNGVLHCEEKWPSDTLLEVYWVSMFVIQYLVPLCVIAVLAGITAYTLKKNALLAALESCAHSEVYRKSIHRRTKQTQRITKMLIALVLLYAICMLPQHVVYTFWARYGKLPEKSYMTRVFIVANIFPIANSALNAIAYGTLNKEFKGVFKALLSCVCCTISGRRDLCGRDMEHTMYSWIERPDTKNQQGQLLLEEWENGREAATSSEPKPKGQRERTVMWDLRATEGREHVGMKCKSIQKKITKDRLLGSEGRNRVEERETVL